MKKFLAVLMVVFLALSTSAFAQVKRETRAEKKARIEKLVKDGVANKVLFIEVTRLCPINGVAQNVVYGNDGYYIKILGNRISCNLPYIGNNRSVAYGNNSDININSDKQDMTLMGGWQDKDKCYIFQTIFWNGNKSEGPNIMQVTLTMQIYTSGEVFAKVDIVGMDSMSYVGEVDNEPAAK
jgi:hypothetical protein